MCSSMVLNMNALTREEALAIYRAGPEAAVKTLCALSADNLPSQITLPDTRTLTYTYDAAKRLVGENAAGRITQLAGDGADWNYQYDAISRLAQAAHGADTSTYAFDPSNNILNNGRQYDTANRLNVDNDQVFTYDALGNLTQKQHKITGARTVYSWNAKSQLSRVERYPNATATTPTKVLQYTYDALGRRLSKTEDGVMDRYVYDGLDLIAVLNAAGTPQKRFTFGPGIDEPLGMTTAGGLLGTCNVPQTSE